VSNGRKAYVDVLKFKSVIDCNHCNIVLVANRGEYVFNVNSLLSEKASTAPALDSVLRLHKYNMSDQTSVLLVL